MSTHNNMMLRHNSLKSSNVDLGIPENILIGLATFGGIYAAKKLTKGLLAVTTDQSTAEGRASLYTKILVGDYAVDGSVLAVGLHQSTMGDNRDVGIPVSIASSIALAYDAYGHYKINKKLDELEKQFKADKAAGNLSETVEEKMQAAKGAMALASLVF